jgi:EAL domain-containing protein (putative c-di-GMP-specific phosphodiesterase class I)
LTDYPVLAEDGRLVHRECMLRLPQGDGAAVLTAGQFMPAAVRVGLASACDLEAVRLGIARLAETSDPIAINVAPRSLIEPGFLERLDVLLAGAGAAAARISVEVSERGLDPQLAGLEGWPKCWRGMARSWGSNISAASWRRCRACMRCAWPT